LLYTSSGLFFELLIGLLEYILVFYTGSTPNTLGGTGPAPSMKIAKL